MAANERPQPDQLASRLDILFSELSQIAPPAPTLKSVRRASANQPENPAEIASYLQNVQQDLNIRLRRKSESDHG